MTSRTTVGATAAALAVLLAGCTPAPGEQPATGVSSTTNSSTSQSKAGQNPLSAKEQQRVNEQLIAAAWDNDVARARKLVRDGADVNYADSTQQSAYLIAASEGYTELLDLTLNHGAEINAKDSYNGTALIRAAERGHAAVVGRLVQAGIDLDHVNRLGWTALHEAVVLGDGTDEALRTVRVLVAAGVDVTVPARDGKTAREHAEGLGYDEQAAVLETAERGAEPSPNELLRAAGTGDADAVAIALRSRAELESRDDRRRTPLLLAVTDGHLDVARLLVQLGADPDALDDRHDTPWLVTGVTGSVPMAELLLTADPDLTILNRYGGTSLIPASERGHVDYVRRVVRTDIDVNHVNRLGWTALLEAVVLGEGTDDWQRIVKLLLEHGADPNIADSDGVTALEHAHSRGFTEIAAIIADAD